MLNKSQQRIEIFYEQMRPGTQTNAFLFPFLSLKS